MVSEGAEIGEKGVEKEVVTKRATLVEDKLLDKVTAKKIFLGSPISFTFKSGTGGLSEDTSDEDLRQYFSQYGVVAKVEQLIHPETGRKKGVAFISFDDDDCVDKIVLIGAHIIKGRSLEAQKAQSERGMNERASGEFEDRKAPTDPEDVIMRKVFVRSLPVGVQEEDIRASFSEFGELEEVRCPIPKAQENQDRKITYCFLTFVTSSAVDAAMEARPVTVKGKEVVVKRAFPPGFPRELENCKKIFLGSPAGLDLSRVPSCICVIASLYLCNC